MTQRPISHRLWLVGTAAMLAGIFIQSLLPPAVSGAESGWVAELFGRIFGAQSAVGRFLITYVRKLAHVAEYAVLGLLVCKTASCYRLCGSRRTSVCLCFLGFFVGFLDESLQILSRRGPAIADVWLDAAGFAVGYLCLFFLLRGVERRSKTKTNKSKSRPKRIALRSAFLYIMQTIIVKTYIMRRSMCKESRTNR